MTELASVVSGSQSILKIIAYESPVLTLERVNGERVSISVESLDDIVVAFNQQLERLGDKRRFVALV